MIADIVIVRDNNEYRLLHGHLRLLNALATCREVLVDTKDEGRIRIIKTPAGFFAGQENQYLPLLRG